MKRLFSLHEGVANQQSAFWLKVLFSFFAALFGFGIKLRNKAYDCGLFKVEGASLPVISIGNIAAGGTGKTPLTFLLAKELSKKNKIAILSRGYRSQLEHAKISREVTLEMDASLAGDEPLWFKRNLPDVAVYIGKNRLSSASLAAGQKREILLLDDGMQYRRLKKDVEIVLLDANDLFGKNSFLPRGYLRDDPKRLKAADLIVLTHICSEETLLKAKAALAPLTSAPVIGAGFFPSSEPSLEGKRVAAFCAIGKPNYFLHALAAMGCELLSTLIKQDHEPFSLEELDAFIKKADADYLVCTEKDFIKIPAVPSLSLPIIPVKTEIKIVYGQEHWYNLLEKIQEMRIS
jgi:tetraacyldisaccharide 4'-kinase